VAGTKDMWSTGRMRDRVTAAAYDFGVEHEPLARVGGALMWGADARLLYRSIRRLSETPPGASILDLPCGGGVAFRGLQAEQDVRYVAADLSPFMLRRARAAAARLGLRQIEFREADVEALPFADEEFDLVLTYSGLHCFPDPELALRELARCLRTGGVLRGDCAVRGQRGRSDGLIRLYQRAGIFGPAGGASEVDAWVQAAGLSYVQRELSGAVVFFEARKPAPGAA
jgi:SAM-dependent methyltransferase